MFRLNLILCLLSVCLGCSGEASTPSTNHASVNTPQGQFEWAMQRLERAILDFGPSGSSGLIAGNRRISHELFEPEGESGHYTALVTVTTEATYVPDTLPSVVDKEKAREKKREKMRKMEALNRIDGSENEVFDPLADRFSQQMEDLAAEGGGPTKTAPLIEAPTTEETKIYELAYLEDRWQLQTEVSTEHEELWFQYALGEDLE